MARERLHIQPHLPEEDLLQRYRSCREGKERSRWQAIWLLSRAEHSLSAEEVGALVGFSPDWVRKLARRYNTLGPQGLRNRRPVKPGGPRPLLDQTQQLALSQALRGLHPAGGTWSGPKVALWIGQVTGKTPSAVTGWTYLRKLGVKAPLQISTIARQQPHDATPVIISEPVSSDDSEESPSGCATVACF